MEFIAAWSHPAKIGVLLSGLLIAAVVGIRLARMAHAPRVVGYLLLGIVSHYILQWTVGGAERFHEVLDDVMPATDVIKSIALCLILFLIGVEFDGAHVRAVASHLWKLTLAETLAIGIGVFLATWAAAGSAHWVPAVFLCIAAMETAPAATVHVLRQYEAKGAVTDHILGMTGLNNLVAIVAFYVAFLLLAKTGAISVQAANQNLVVSIILATVGSAVIGFLLGMALSMAHIALTRFESVLVFFALILAITTLASPLGLNGLILSMFMGVAFTNFSIQPQRLREELAPLSAPILVLFFVLAGFKLELEKLWHVGAIGIAFIVLRATGKIGGAWLGVQWAGIRNRVTPEIGTAMLCQAGVAIGLGKYLLEHWGVETNGRFVADPGAQTVNTVIIASVAFFELIGPLSTKRVVVRSGEVKLLNLLTRRGGSMREMRTVLTRLRRALQSPNQRGADQEPEELTVRHTMRTNVESLRDTAKMAEVLHFVERSRLSHFFVVDAEGHFIGTISFRDLRNLMFNPMMAQLLTAYDMANTAPEVALADQPLKEVLELFHKHDFGSLPVIEDAESRRLLGVIEQRDVLRALHLQTSTHETESEM